MERFPLLKEQSRQLLVTVCCLLCLLATSQTTWNRTYVEDRPVMLFSSIIGTDSIFYIMGATVNKQPPYITQGLFFKKSQSGSNVSYMAIPDSINVLTGLFWNTLLKANQNKYVFTGSGGDSTQHVVFGFASSGFDSVKIYRYKTPNTYAFQGLSMLEKDNYYYVSGVHNFNPGFNANVVLMKIDSVGNLLWEKYYDQKKMDYSQSMIALTTGNILLGTVRNDLNQTNEKANTWLLEVDTGGNVVRQWFDPNDSTYVAEGLRQTQDGGFIYGAQKKNYQSGLSSVSYNATIVKMDYNFNKQWTFIRGGNDLSIYTGITDIEELPDGNFVAAGHLTYYGNDTTLNGYLVKLSANGNVVWERNYRGISASQSLNFLTDIDVLPDGGLIAVGQCQLSGATPPQVGWFLKLDSNGCEVENCLVGIDPQTPEGGLNSHIQVYPNPASGYVQIEVSSEMIGGEVKVYDVHGRVVKKFEVSGLKLVVEVSDWSKGMYVITAEKEGMVARGKLVVE